MEQTNNNTSVGTGIKRPLCRGFFELVYKHPIISAGILCLFSMLMSTGEINLFKASAVAFGITALGCAAAWCAATKDKNHHDIQKGIALACASAAGAAVFIFSAFNRGTFFLVVMNGGLALCAGIFLYLLAGKSLNTKSAILLIFAAGFIMRLAYILMMPSNIVQHDVYSPGKEAGHAGYIEYIYNNGHLPDFDVHTVDQFYHPPLHHIIAALWMRLQTFLGIDYLDAYENIQILTLFYSTVCLILCYKIFRRVGLDGSALITATAILAFCPIFYIMSGSINNDILSITFLLGAVLNTLYWYKSRSMGRIICIALCIGLGMMTKLSVWMVAPAIAFIFLFAFFTDLKRFRKYLLQFTVFIVICAPLALFWSVRNYLMWGISPTYVQRLSPKSHQFIGDIPFFQRLFGIEGYMFEDVAPQFKSSPEFHNDYNPIVNFFKTSVFDEGIATWRFPAIEGYNQPLFWTAVLLGITAFVAMIFMLFKKDKKLSMPIKSFIMALYLVFFLMYYAFCFDFPHVCTMNVRYGIPLIVIGALSFGFLVRELFKSKKFALKITGGVLCALIAAYAFTGYMVYNIVANSVLIMYY